MKIRELGQRAERLIEVGNELENQKSYYENEKEQALLELSAAYHELVSAREKDDDEKHRENVTVACTRVKMARANLERIEKDLQDCVNQIEVNHSEKNKTVWEITDINNRELHNLSVLKALQAKRFSQNANMILADLIARMNSGEEAKDYLLASMGLRREGVRYSLGENNSGDHNEQVHSIFDVFTSNITKKEYSNNTFLENTYLDKIESIDSQILDDRDKTNEIIQLSFAEKRQRGERYINNILQVYRDTLLDKGVISISALDTIMKELKNYYKNELEKDILGQPNGLYVDPNYDELIEKINNYHQPIASVVPGSKMTFEEANSGHVNPDYCIESGNTKNCQSCVVVFEARIRGYDVQVLPYKDDSIFERLAYDPRLAWIDPKTGEHPRYLYDESRRTPEKYLDFLNETIRDGERYTIQFAWKGRRYSGHIVNVDRNRKGLLRIKDNQRGVGEQSEWIGEYAVLEYLSRMKYEDKSILGGITPCVPKLLRIDNMDFDYSIVNYIMKGAERNE